MQIHVNEIGFFFWFYIFRRGSVNQMMILIKHVLQHFHHKEDCTGCQAGKWQPCISLGQNYGCHFLSPFILSNYSNMWLYISLIITWKNAQKLYNSNQLHNFKPFINVQSAIPWSVLNSAIIKFFSKVTQYNTCNPYTHSSWREYYE